MVSAEITHENVEEDGRMRYNVGVKQSLLHHTDLYAARRKRSVEVHH